MLGLERSDGDGPGPLVTVAAPGFAILAFAPPRGRLDAIEAAMMADESSIAAANGGGAGVTAFAALDSGPGGSPTSGGPASPVAPPATVSGLQPAAMFVQDAPVAGRSTSPLAAVPPRVDAKAGSIEQAPVARPFARNLLATTLSQPAPGARP